jgi:hypothetical protein
MKLFPVLVLVTGCASATPPPSSPSASAASAAAPCAPRTYELVDDSAGSGTVLPNQAMRVCVDQAERDRALVDHWIAACGERNEPEDPACRREHEAMFDTLEMHRKRCTEIEGYAVAVDDRLGSLDGSRH